MNPTGSGEAHRKDLYILACATGHKTGARSHDGTPSSEACWRRGSLLYHGSATRGRLPADWAVASRLGGCQQTGRQRAQKTPHV